MRFKINLSLLGLAIVLCMPAFAQKRVVATDAFSSYNRNGISIIVTDYGDTYQSDFARLVEDFEMSPKYDVNEIETDVISYSQRRTTKSPDKVTLKKNFVPELTISRAILTKLNDENVGKEILEYYLNPDDEGVFSRDIIDQRGMWNATDKDFEEAQKTEVDAMGQNGEKLIARSFILVYDMNNPKQIEIKKKDKNGNVYYEYLWEADVMAFVYKIANAEEVVNNVINNMWIYDTDDEATKGAKKEAFDNLKVNLELVLALGHTETAANLEASYETSIEKLFAKLENNISEWQVAIDCETVRPYITAKVGKKEGVTNGERFGIYGQVYNKKANRNEFKRKGYARATVVANNMKVADGNQNPTYFYRISGIPPMKGNEILKERKDSGFSFSLTGSMNGSLSEPTKNRTFGSFAFANITVDYLAYIGKKGGSHYILMDFGIDYNSGTNLEKGQNEFGSYDIVYDPDDNTKFLFKDGVTFLNFSLGYMYGFKIGHTFEIQPYLKVGGDMISAGIDEKKLKHLAEFEHYTPEEAINKDNASNQYAVFVEPGARLTYNLWYPLQLFVQVNYSAIVYEVEAYKIINKYLKDCGYGHDAGAGFGGGIRICL